MLKVLRGQPQEASDKLSFIIPPIHSEEDYRNIAGIIDAYTLSPGADRVN